MRHLERSAQDRLAADPAQRPFREAHRLFQPIVVTECFGRSHRRSPMAHARRPAILALSVLLATALFAEPVLSQSQREEQLYEKDLYRPTDAVLAELKPERALEQLRELAGLKPKSREIIDKVGDWRFEFFIDGRELSAFRPLAEARKIEIYEDRIEFVLARANSGPTTYYFHELPADLRILKDSIVLFQFGVPLSKDRVLWCSGGLNDMMREACAMRLADALFVLRKASAGLASDDRKFDEVVAQYRALGAASAIPEEVRRYKVQAEFMVDQKRYGDAIRLYGEGLKAAPWWPGGRFNRALLFAEMKRYRDAIMEMNRYLKLEPDAPDARAAQDLVYKWEAAMKLSGRN